MNERREFIERLDEMLVLPEAISIENEIILMHFLASIKMIQGFDYDEEEDDSAQLVFTSTQ